MTSFHKGQPFDQNHIVTSLEFANAAARLGYIAVPGDVGRIAKQIDTQTFWILTNDSPLIWKPIDGATLIAHGVTHKGDGADPVPNVTTAVAGLMSATDKTLLDSLTQGNVSTQVRNETGATLLRGRLVSVVGYSVPNLRPLVQYADKDDLAKRPALGILLADMLDGTNSQALVNGTLTGLDTSLFVLTDQLVLGNAGVFILPPPGNSPFTGEIQNIGSVSRVHATDGEVVVGIDGMQAATAPQVFALQGTTGAPSDVNRYVTDTDSRNTNARTPTLHAVTHLPGGSDALVTGVPVSVDKTVNEVGVATSFSRSDHKHDVLTATPGVVTFGAAAEGSASSLARSDHVHALTAPSAPVAVTKAAAVAGVSANVAREDHKHDVSTASPGTIQPDDGAAEGTATSLSRSDHRHAISTAVPVDIGVLNSEGVATDFARSDHVHAHGSLVGGVLHAAVTTLIAGFMSAPDKLKLDGISSGAAALTAVPPTTIAPDDSAAVGTGTAAAREDHRHAIVADVPVPVTKSANVEGASTSFSRADHKHDVSTATPGVVTFGAASEGTSTSLTRADHTHALTVPVAPADVTKAAANAGSSANVAREDHKHDISTAVPGTIQPDDSAAEGTATSLARSDHTHAIAAATAGTIAVGDAASEGSSTSFGRADHTHALPAPAAPVDVTKAAASAGAATTVARSDHKHDVSTGVPGTVTYGAAAEGTATTLARSDHTHALTASGAPVNVTKAAAAAGTSANVAREDHKHDVTTAAPVSIGIANSEGTATSLARSDHVHDGNRAITSPLHWGNANVASTTTTRYLSPGWEDGTAPTTAIQWRISSAGILRNLRVRHNITAGNGNAIVYTLRVNGAASALTVSLASTSADGSDLANTPAVAAGDLIDIEITKAVSVGTSPSDVMVSLELAASS